MVTCQHCGHVNPTNRRECARCNAALLAQAPAPRSAKHTVLGMPSPNFPLPPLAPAEQPPQVMQQAASVAQAGQTPAPAQATLIEGSRQSSPPTARTGSLAASTLFGLAPPKENGLDLPPPPARMKQTLIGMAAPGLGQSSPLIPQPELPPASLSRAPQNPLGRTMLGGHQAPSSERPPPALPFTKPGGTQIGYADPNPEARSLGSNPGSALSALGVGGPPSRGPFGTFPGGSDPGKTLLGVAQPGVAPLNPGLAKPSAVRGVGNPPSVAEQIRQPRIEPTPLGFEDSELALAGVPSRTSKGGWVLLALAVLLLLLVLLFVLFWAPAKPIEGRVELDPKGRETLVLSCSDCKDGTRVTLQGQTATFQSSSASVILPNPLSVGNNALQVALERPGMGRNEEVQLDVPLRFRVFADLSRLNDPSPSLLVRLHAEPGAAAVVDGSAIRFINGQGELLLPLEKELLGQATHREPLAKEVKYSLTLGDGSVSKGSLKPNLRIAPLVVEAPGPSAITDSEHFMLAGRTAPGGAVSVAGKPITVDREGRFAQLMSVDSEGETKIFVRASLAEHAPRLVQLKVRRTSDLRKVAEEFRKTALTDYRAFAKGAALQQGLAVAVEGRVEEAKVGGHSTILLLDVAVGCDHAPCLARVVIGARKKLTPGTVITAYGHLSGAVEGPVVGVLIPDVRAEFLVE